jgi:peptidoglycan/xylan/chitin deacetylase (PgdA/CDA1 family)
MFFTFRFNQKLAALLVTAAAILIAACTIAANPAQAANTPKGVKLPIIMYHSMLKDSKYQGKYVISPDMFEKDLVYLQKNGYTTIFMQDLIDYVDNKSELPAKPILLTFDDGYYNNYLYAYPLAQKYKQKIVISPIGYYMDLFSKESANHANYSHCTWDQVKEMMSSELVEIQNHTYNLHDSKKGKRTGVCKLQGESTASYQSALKADFDKMQQEMKENTGYEPTTFVYPFGAVCPEAVAMVKSYGFRASITCQYKINAITRNPDCLYGLGRYLRPSGISSERYFEKIGVN